MIAEKFGRFLRDSSAVRVSRSMRDVAYKVLKTRENYVREHQREPGLRRLPKSWGCAGKRLCLRWMPSQIPSLCTSPSILMAATRSA